jgi:nicotinate-nucleotide adenylyltransferase
VRLGIFGGSFDPPHIGHVLAAIDATEQLVLDRLLWIPTAQQPLKTGAPHHATPAQRYRMVEAATTAHPAFVPSRIEIDRDGLSYTVTTLEALAREYPESERFLLLGNDAWNGFTNWHQPERIRTLVRVAVLVRPVQTETPQGGDEEGSFPAPPQLGRRSRPSEEQRQEAPLLIPNRLLEPDLRLETRHIQVSSTEIRARQKAGKPIRGFVPDKVAEIIESEGLYRW